MEIKIGLVDSAKELVVQIDTDIDGITKKFESDLANDALSRFEDKDGRVFLIQTSKIAYLEIANAASRPVGFGPY